MMVAVALVMLGCSPKPEPTTSAPLTAWWVDIQFQPGSATTSGFDAHSMDKNWKHISALEADMLKGRIPDEEIEAFRKSGYSFSLKSDLDGDGVLENFFVGVYETNQGERGRFVAIARNGRVVKHFAESGTVGFSALQQGDGEVHWYKCMECNDFDTIRWSEEDFTLE
ncbi:MAG TPA: hypothetical protein VIN38_00210 [Thiobacillus sp.]